MLIPLEGPLGGYLGKWLEADKGTAPVSSDLTLREVTHENWRTALQLVVHPEQQRFVADTAPIAAIALAKAYIRPRGLLWLPYAFLLQEKMIGFAMIACDAASSDDYWLFHFFIDRSYQGNGYGRQSLRLLLAVIKRQFVNCIAVRLTVHPDNLPAQRLYTREGFQPTGDILDGEAVYRLLVNPS